MTGKNFRKVEDKKTGKKRTVPVSGRPVSKRQTKRTRTPKRAVVIERRKPIPVKQLGSVTLPALPKMNGFEKRAYEDCLKEAKKDREEILAAKKKGKTLNEYQQGILDKGFVQDALDKYEYLKLRAKSGFDPVAEKHWKLVTREGVKHYPDKILRDERGSIQGFIYKTGYKLNHFYVIRWLKSGKGWHFYPADDFMLPDGFASRVKAEEQAKEAGGKVVSGRLASRFPVPARW